MLLASHVSIDSRGLERVPKHLYRHDGVSSACASLCLLAGISTAPLNYPILFALLFSKSVFVVIAIS